MSLSVWFRIIRFRFLLASVLSVILGLVISYWKAGQINLFDSVLTMGGVLALHASVDLLNDFWDYKRGIDTSTKRTKFSGGTGVLPEGLLRPSVVYRTGVLCLVLGSLAGAYFVFVYGWVIAVILGFAVISIYFYSTKIVNIGLGELFVAIKAAMIVIGTIYIQTQLILPQSVSAGIISGVFSSFVLFITSFPDYDADKQKGRKTLVIILGKNKARHLYWLFPFLAYFVGVFGVIFNLFPVFCLLMLATMPLVVKTGIKMHTYQDNNAEFESIMGSVVLFSRITAALFIIGFIIQILIE